MKLSIECTCGTVWGEVPSRPVRTPGHNCEMHGPDRERIAEAVRANLLTLGRWLYESVPVARGKRQPWEDLEEAQREAWVQRACELGEDVVHPPHTSNYC